MSDMLEVVGSALKKDRRGDFWGTVRHGVGYRSLFKRELSTQQVERVASFIALPHSISLPKPELDIGSDFFLKTCANCDIDIGQRFVWSFSPYTVSYMFYVVADDDERTEIGGAKPVKVKDVDAAIDAMDDAHCKKRYYDAVSVFDSAFTYNASVGGDGQPPCSSAHPRDGGIWSNVLDGDGDLTAENVTRALRCIEDNFVDEQGVKIKVHGKHLVISNKRWKDVEDLCAADVSDFPHFNWYPVLLDLKDANHWFITTTIDGLKWFEREPYVIEAFLSEEHEKCVVVSSHERRVFGCADPRAIFGAGLKRVES